MQNKVMQSKNVFIVFNNSLQLIIEVLTKMKLAEELVNTIVQEGHDNLIEFLLRDIPQKMGIDLLIRGHQVVGQFLLQLDECQSLIRDKFLEQLDMCDYNIWSLKVLVKMNWKMDKLSRVSRILHQHNPAVFIGSGQVLQSLFIVNKSLEDEDGSHVMAMREKKWLPKVWRNRRADIRILGFQIAAKLACFESGVTEFLKIDSSASQDFTDLWKTLLDIVLDSGGTESYVVKTCALEVLHNLLVLGSRKGSQWYGPLIPEKISGIRLTGQASLRPFLQALNFEQIIEKQFNLYDRYHHSRYQHWEREESESVRLNSLTGCSTVLTDNEATEMLSVIENPPTVDFVATVLKFLRLIVHQDTCHGEKYSSMPKLRTSLFPTALKLLSNNLKIEDQSMIYALTDFFMICSVNYSWAVDTMLEEDKCTCLSILVTTYHRLDLQADKLLELLAFLLSESSYEEESEVSRMIQKYRFALLQLCVKNPNDNFCAAISKFLVGGSNSIDNWGDPQLVQDLAKFLIRSKRHRALRHLMLVSTIAQECVLEEQVMAGEFVHSLGNLKKDINDTLSFLNNFCFKNPPAQKFLVEDLCIHRRLVPLASKICEQLLIAAPDVKRNNMVMMSNLLSFLVTLTANSPGAKATLPLNIWIEKGRATSMMLILTDLITNRSSFSLT